MLQAVGINKSFGANRVLRDVDLSFAGGQIHALVGENGAGKSTLVKILAGLYSADSGSILLEEKSVGWRDPAQAQAAGISLIPQELNLARHLSVAENIFLGIESSRFGLLRDEEALARTTRLIEEYELDFGPRDGVRLLSPSQRQQVEILRSLVRAQKVLILDESTAYFSERESLKLFRTLRELRRRGLCLIFITHRLEELEGLVDWVSILRDGECVASRPLTGSSLAEVLSLMVGGGVEEVFPAKTSRPGEPLLDLKDVALAGQLSGVTFEVRRGEVFGLGGFVGSRRTRLAELLFGLHPGYSGQIRFEGRKVELSSPTRALELGIAFVTEDRKATGIFPHLPVRENVSLLSLESFARFHWIREAEERRAVEGVLRQLAVRCRGGEQRMSELSGGNQQKCVLGRWLMREPRLLILDEPTRGIDMGARVELYRWFDRLAARGLGILLISSDLRELEGLCHRVAVFREGRMVGLLEGDGARRSQVVRLAALDEGRRHEG